MLNLGSVDTQSIEGDHIKPLLTIGLCARNSEKTINLAIDSIFRQDLSHDLIEIIFVDDGSTDNTLALMNETIRRTNIKIRVFSGPWQGISKARNTVLSNAQGKYVLWVDSDVILTDNYARNQVKLIDSNPKLGIVIGQIGILPGQNSVLVLELIPYLLLYLKNSWQYPFKMPGTCAAIHRLSAAKDVGGFNDEIVGTGEDIEFASRLVRAGWLIKPGSSVFFETHKNMITLQQLWNKYVNNGYHARKMYEKYKFFSFYRINPLSSLVTGLFYSVEALVLLRKKTALLLPFHFSFKMTAWFYGFSIKTEK